MNSSNYGEKQTTMFGNFDNKVYPGLRSEDFFGGAGDDGRDQKDSGRGQNSSDRVNDMLLAGQIVQLLEHLDFVRARNVLNIVSMSYAHKLVPNSATVSLLPAREKKGQAKDNGKSQKPGKDKVVKAKEEKPPPPPPQKSSFNKTDASWLKLQEEIKSANAKVAQATKDEEPEADIKQLRDIRTDLMTKAKAKKISLQEAQKA